MAEFQAVAIDAIRKLAPGLFDEVSYGVEGERVAVLPPDASAARSFRPPAMRPSRERCWSASSWSLRRARRC